MPSADPPAAASPQSTTGEHADGFAEDQAERDTDADARGKPLARQTGECDAGVCKREHGYDGIHHPGLQRMLQRHQRGFVFAARVSRNEQRHDYARQRGMHAGFEHGKPDEQPDDEIDADIANLQGVQCKQEGNAAAAAISIGALKLSV